MSYVTHEDIALRLGSAVLAQLTDDAGTGEASEALVSQTREAAEGEVDSYLARRYRVPIDVAAHERVRAVIGAAVLDIVEYRLHTRRPPVPADVAVRYGNVIRWLSRVAAGEVVLPSSGALPANDATGPVAGIFGNPARLSHREWEWL